MHSMVWPMDLDEGTQALSLTMVVGGAEIAERQIQEEMEAILMAVLARMEETEREGGEMDVIDAEEGTDYVPELRDQVNGRHVSTATEKPEQRNCSPMLVCQAVTTGGCAGDLNGLQEKEAGLPLSVSPLGIWVAGEDICSTILMFHFVGPKSLMFHIYI